MYVNLRTMFLICYGYVCKQQFFIIVPENATIQIICSLKTLSDLPRFRVRLVNCPLISVSSTTRHEVNTCTHSLPLFLNNKAIISHCIIHFVFKTFVFQLSLLSFVFLQELHLQAYSTYYNLSRCVLFCFDKL